MSFLDEQDDALTAPHQVAYAQIVMRLSPRERARLRSLCSELSHRAEDAVAESLTRKILVALEVTA